MQGPIVDIALLVMLVLFFGRQQSRRPEIHYRLWFVGWIFVLLSYAAWEFPMKQLNFIHVQNAIRFDLMLAGTLLFLVSFLTSRERLWKVITKGMLVGLPVVAVFDALEFFVVPRVVLMTAVLAWEAYGLRAAYVVIPRGRVKTRVTIFSACVVFGLAMVFYLALTPGRDMVDWALAETVFCCAVLYGGGLQKRTISVYVGMAGFVMWGGFYLWADLLAHGWPRTLQVMFLFWSVPKYFVGSSMIMKTFEDETDEKAKVAEAYRSLYEDFRTMYEEHPEPMWIFEPSGGRFLSANATALNQYGFSMEEFQAMSAVELTSLSDTERNLIESLYPGSKLKFARHRFKDGREIWANVDSHTIQFAGSEACLLTARDVTEQLESRLDLAHQAHHDVLTGLPNRALLEDRIQQSFKRCERDGRKATLLTIDIDHFKRINDTYGHPVGDECLQVVAARLAAKIRQVDTIARVGGEEFAAIIGGLHTAEDAGKVADSLLRVFEEPLRLAELDMFVTVSIGIAVYPDDAQDAETLKRRSDEALYAAKGAGRNRAVFASAMVSLVGAENAVAGRREFADPLADESLLW